jgi:hypothetical protein
LFRERTVAVLVLPTLRAGEVNQGSTAAWIGATTSIVNAGSCPDQQRFRFRWYHIENK